jgi:heavy metal translocating P-type ATPase
VLLSFLWGAQKMLRRYSLSVEGMHCAACAETVAKALMSVKGVRKAIVNIATERALIEVEDGIDFRAIPSAVENAGYKLTTRTLNFALDKPLDDKAIQTLLRSNGVIAVEVSRSEKPLPASTLVQVRYIDGVISRSEIQRTLQSLGFEVLPVEVSTPEKPAAEEAQVAWRRAWVGLAISLVVMALTMLPSLAHQVWAGWLAFALTTFVVFWVGTTFFRRAWKAALNLNATMDTLVSIGAISAYAYSTWLLLASQLAHHSPVGHLYFDSAAFILSAISLGKGLEARARAIATSSLHQLVRLLPSTATVIRNGLERTVPLAEVQVGDLVMVRAGERVPVDGLVVSGKASVDESLLTGESEPVVKNEGDEVLGGSLCVDGFSQVEALRVGETTFIAQMTRLMDEAQASKPAMQRLADKVAGVFVPIVLLLATATFLGWLILSGDLTKAVIAAVSVTVIACPCAMGLATPTAIAVALGRLAQMGILVRNAEAMEKAAEITSVVLDKTGTVTQGQMEVVAVWSPKFDEAKLLQIAASAERSSSHPIAQAIVKEANKRGLELLEIADARSEVGLGVSAKIVSNGQKGIRDENEVAETDRTHEFDGTEVFVGKVGEGELENTPAKDWLDNGWSIVGVWLDGEFVGCIALSDQLRPDAREAVQRLKEMGVKVFLATGDKPQVAMLVADQLNCDGVLALANPQRKLQFVRDLQKDGERVLMVGDGINDAVALSQADIGVALATGAELTAQAADVLMVTSRLTVVADFLSLAKKTKRIMLQNLFWAFAYNMAALPLAAAGKLNPMIAAIAMALSSITVVTNALRLKREGTR